jgi:hypothetical protein
VTPVLHAPFFSFTHGVTTWSRMARVLDYTARLHNPGWEVHVDEIDALGTYEPLNRSANAMKLAEWKKRVEEAPDGTHMLLMDTDMVVMHPLESVWETEFDIAFTVRPDRMAKKSIRIPLNGGVVYLRVSELVKKFFRTWQLISETMTRDRALHRRWHRRWGGQNQAALGAIIESAPPESEFASLVVNWLQCSEDNACDPEWADHWQTAKILHLKSDLRQALFDPIAKPERHLKPIVAHWLELEKAAG